LAPAREPVVRDPEVETLLPGASADESVVELAETRVLSANSAQAAVGRSRADPMWPEAASLAKVRPERDSERGRVAERVSERDSERGRVAERVSERDSERGRVAEEPEVGLGGEPARAPDRVRMKSMEFWAR
jgi:hypothetical protein